MGPVVHAVAPGVGTVVLAGCALAAAALVATVLLARRAGRRRSVLDAELERSRAEVDDLGRKVEELSDAVSRARRDAEEDREYVITSLSGDRDVDVPPRLGSQGQVPVPGRPPVGRPPLGRLVEDTLVATLARQPRASAVRARAVDVVVRTVAVTSGLRRALSPDVLDRAAAEAHVARRRSRRHRRRQEREARRIVRTASADQDVA